MWVYFNVHIYVTYTRPTDTDSKGISPQEHLHPGVLWCFCLPKTLQLDMQIIPILFLHCILQSYCVHLSHYPPASETSFNCPPSTQALWSAFWIHGCEGWCWVENPSHFLEKINEQAFFHFSSLISESIWSVSLCLDVARGEQRAFSSWTEIVPSITPIWPPVIIIAY